MVLGLEWAVSGTSAVSGSGDFRFTVGPLPDPPASITVSVRMTTGSQEYFASTDFVAQPALKPNPDWEQLMELVCKLSGQQAYNLFNNPLWDPIPFTEGLLELLVQVAPLVGRSTASTPREALLQLVRLSAAAGAAIGTISQEAIISAFNTTSQG